MLNSKLLLATVLGLSAAAFPVASINAQVPTAATPGQAQAEPGQSMSGQAAPADTTQPISPSDTAALSSIGDSPAIAIGPGDLLNITVFETPELSASARVTQDGNVDLPVLGPVHVSGLDPQQAASALQAAYRDRGLLLNPHVTVSETEFASQGATVIGEVRAPGVYPTLGSRRLLDMLSLAGGVASTSGRLVSIIHRGDPNHPVQVALQPNPASLHAQLNPVILPGDTVVVAKSGVIYIIGDVLRPGGILVDNNERLSLIEALSLAGGMNKTAALSQTRLIRKLPTGRAEIDLDLKHVLYGKQADILVSDGDILYVPSSFGKTLLYRGIEAAFGIAANEAIYLH